MNSPPDRRTHDRASDQSTSGASKNWRTGEARIPAPPGPDFVAPSPSPPGEEADEVLTPEEVSLWLKVSERTLDDWRYKQKGPPSHRVGRHVRYLADEVRTWLRCQ